MPDQASASLAPTGIGLLQRRLVTAAIMLGMFMAAVESSIVSPAMPTIAATLGGLPLFTWVFSIYVLAQAVSIPIYGRLADNYGRKRVFCIGVGIFLLGSALCGLAWRMEALIGFRLLQGLGAGAIIPIGSTIIADIYSPADRARLQGWLSSVWAFAAVVGPLLGAFIIQHLSWALIFWINVPVGVLTIIMLALCFREHARYHRRAIDYGGALLLVIGSGALMLALTEANQLSSGALVSLAVVATLGLATLIRHEFRTAEPMLRLDLWRDRFIVLGNLGSMVTGAIMMGVTVFVPIYVQGAMGRDVVIAAFALTTLSLGWSSASVIAGQVMLRSSYRMAALLGGLSLVLGDGALIFLQPSSGPLWAGTGALLIGMGMGFTSTTFMVSIQSAVRHTDRGTATSAMMFMRFVGQSIGAGLFGAVFNRALFAGGLDSTDVVDRLMEPGLRQGLDPTTIARTTGEIAAAVHDVYRISLCLALLALLLTAALPGEHSPHAERPD